MMDIHQWLEETAEAAASGKPVETATSNFPCSPEQPKRVFRAKRARQHSKSDSSILAPHPHLHKAPLEVPSLPAEDVTNASACSRLSRSSHNQSAGSDSSSHRYARRPRHKTRPERYEPKRSKESRKYVHPSRKDKPKQSASRSKNKRREKTDSAAGQTFHAKNISKDRLTLKPREQLGLFNKGKTSTAVRGRGLPDLVFSEMKFLQKEHPSPEPNVQEALPKKRRKKGHIQNKEGEISAYFTAVRPALAEKDSNAQPHPLPSATAVATRNRSHGQTQSRKSSDVVATIEMPDKGTYVGFGRRAPRHASTSYVSWSESVREPEATFSRPKQPSTSPLDHANSPRPDWMRHATNDAQYTHATQTTPHGDHLESNSSIERFRISSVAGQQPTVSRSHSYPRQSSSPQKVNLIDHAKKFRSTESVASPSTLPPLLSTRVINKVLSREADDLARVKARKTSHDTAPNVLRQSNGAAEVEKTLGDGVQQPSSDFENVIKHCNYSVLEREWAADRPEEDLTRNDLHRRRMSNARGEAPRRPNVRFSQMEMQTPGEVLIYAGPSFYDRQAEQQQAALLDHEDLVDMEECCLGGLGMVYTPGAQEYDEHVWDDEGEVSYEEGRVQKLPSDDGVVARGFWRPNKLY